MRKVFIDCGAYTGNSVKKFLSAFEGFEIFSFEPNPFLHHHHQDLPNTLIGKAVWVEDGFIDFYLDQGDYDGSSVFEHKLNIVDKKKISVPTIDFSQWLKNNFNRKDLIILKMDIEGAEYEVLNKMISDGTIEYIDELLVEFHWNKIGLEKQKHDDLIRRLKQQNVNPVGWNANGWETSRKIQLDLQYLKTKYSGLVCRSTAHCSKTEQCNSRIQTGAAGETIKVCLLYDYPGWAWHHRAEAIRRNIHNPALRIDVAHYKDAWKHPEADFVAGFGPNLLSQMASFHPSQRIIGSSNPFNVRSLEKVVRSGLACAGIVNSLWQYNYLTSKERMYYIANGVDTDLFYPAEQAPAEWAACWIGNAGAFNDKGLEIIQAALQKAGIGLHSHHYNSDTSSGSPLAHETLRDQLYHTSAFYICMSKFEGTPNPALEALACGLPVISTPVGNMPEIIKDGYNGFLIERNEESLLAAIEKLRQSDWKTMSRNARNSVLDGWRWADQARRYETLFLELWQARKDRGIATVSPPTYGEIQKQQIVLGTLSRELAAMRKEEKRTLDYEWKARSPLCAPEAKRAELPRVSVLMAVHNGRDHVRQAMDSIYRQTYQNFEFIIVDDASTDGTAEMLQQWKDHRTAIIRNETNLGLTKSLNIGLQHCRGEYIARMDADDISLPERFARQVDFLDRHSDFAMVGSSYYRINGEGTIEKVINVPADDSAIRKWLRQKSPFGHGTVMMRRSVLAGCGGYNERYMYSQDFELWLRLAETHQLANLAEPLYCWRSTPENISNAKSKMQRCCHDRALQEAQQRQVLATPNTLRTAAARPLVSVIVPTYNRPDSLKFAIASILKQSYPNIEILVINDGGADIADQIARWNLHNNIVYLRLETNKGQGAARNAGLCAARGEYIAYLDDDDIFFPDHIERLVTALEGSTYRAAHTLSVRSHQVKQDDRYVEVSRTFPYDKKANHDDLLVQNCVPTLCVMHEKACLKKVGYFDESMRTHQDWDFWIRLSRHYEFLFIPHVTALVTWRTDGTTTTSRNPNEFRRVPEKIYAKYRDWVKDKPDVAARQAERLEQLGKPKSRPSPQSPRPPIHVGPSATERPVQAEPKALTVALKICTPSPKKSLWGDTWFACGLARAIQRAGHRCIIHCRDQWDQPDCDIDAVIHIKGKFEYTPGPHCVNLLWLISHPELHTTDEINRYDAVFCASEKYLAHIRPQINIPCFFLPQAADTAIFKPLEKPPVKDIDLLFVGTNYYGDKRRRIIDDVLASEKPYDLAIIGKNWKGFVEDKTIKAVYVHPEKLPDIYARAKIVLNDHHETMRQWGFINDRTYNLAAMKAFQISDDVEGLDQLGIVTYRTANDLHQKLDHYLAHANEREQNAEICFRRCSAYTFDRAAEQLLDSVKALRKPKSGSAQGALKLNNGAVEAVAGAMGIAPPRVSVIVACRNEEKWLAECLDSILAQTLTDWELLIVDDGSTDRTREIIRTYAARDSRIRMWFFDDSKGPYVRRNFAITQSRAPYISIQDADDVMMPQKLAVLCEHIRSDDRLGVVGSWYRRFLDFIPGLDFGDRVELPGRHEDMLDRFAHTYDMCWHGSAVIRKSLFDEIGLYDENPWSSDSFWLAKAALYSSLTGNVRYMNVPECLTLRRHHIDSQTGRVSNLDPRSRRRRLSLYYLDKLRKIDRAYKDNPGLDAARCLRECTLAEFFPTYGQFYESWESAPVTREMIDELVSKAAYRLGQGDYVFALLYLNLLERMDAKIGVKWDDFYLHQALSLYAAGHDAQAARQMEHVPAGQQQGFDFDFSITDAHERKRRVAAFYQNRLSPAAAVTRAPKTPAISVTMPAYNAARYIRQSIDSVLAQSFGDLELIVVDDGSTDQTVQIVESYRDPRVRLVSQDHQYTAMATNNAIRQARGEFVIGVDSDDIIEPDYLRQLMQVAKACPQFDYYYPRAFKLMDVEARLLEQSWQYRDFGNSGILPAFLFINGFLPIPHPGSLKRRSMFDRVGLYRDLQNTIDYDFMTRNALNIRFKRADGVVGYRYRWRPDSISRQMGQRNQNTAAAMEAMLTRYRPEELCPSLDSTPPDQRPEKFLRFAIGVFENHAKRNAGRGGEHFHQAALRLWHKLQENRSKAGIAYTGDTGKSSDNIETIVSA